MRKSVFFFIVFISSCCFAAQTLNNPIGQDGCYIVKWDCSTSSFASSNDFEADETFTFAVDITGTDWVNWLSGETGRGICTNFSLSSDGAQNISRDGDRLYHIQGNIYGKTINIAQLATAWSTPSSGTQTAIYSNLFGFNASKGEWWQNPSDNIIGNSDCFFKTAAYTGTHTCPAFYTNDFNNIYNWINQKGYAAPCVIDTPCYNQDTGDDDDKWIRPQPLAGSQVYTFPTDSLQRGYYNRPYERYEAEENWCTTNGTFLAASDNQADLQSEASHQQAVQLISQNSYVSWTVNQAGDGLTIRFSLPDSNDGKGTKGNLAIYAGNDQVGTIQLDSYWAWQYTTNGGNYPTNTPATPGGGNVVRMRFDEMHLRLSRQVAAGEVLKLVKTDNNSTPYTIDFVELEPVPAAVTYNEVNTRYPGTLQYNPATDGDLANYVNSHRGSTIYLPAGKIETAWRIYFEQDNMRLIGAGMWYTEVYFNASSDDGTTYSRRGVESYKSNLLIEGIYFNTVNNKRYYNNDDSKQVGKGFNGSFGANSTIRNCWVEHFECGAWFGNYNNGASDNLRIEHCRFRNNYADGVNCSKSMKNVTLQYCSFRNNGDDDMASWSTGGMASNITFAYNTAENNWRASSLGFFGGDGHKAHHIYIADALESGARVNADFGGNGFGNSTIEMHDITIQHCGCITGNRGNQGDFWGNMQGAFNIGSGNNYDVKNISLNHIDIYNSRGHAIMIWSLGNNHQLRNITLKNINVFYAVYNGIYFTNSAKGSMSYCNLSFSNVKYTMNTPPSTLTWTQMADCSTPTDIIYQDAEEGQVHKFFLNGHIYLQIGDACYDSMGRRYE